MTDDEIDEVESGPTPPIGGVPTDNTTLVAVIAELESLGYTGQMVPTGNGRVQCSNCDAVSAAESLSVDQRRRLEGASDPDDMMSVNAVVCPACHEKGTLVLAYGPSASEEDARVAVGLRSAHAEGDAAD